MRFRGRHTDGQDEEPAESQAGNETSAAQGDEEPVKPRESGSEEAAAHISRPAVEAAAAIRAAAEAAAAELDDAGGDEPGRSDAAPDAGADDDATTGAAESAAAERVADLRLARVHLRTGAFALARAELEMLAGEERLDLGATLDLAEVRWRTGDLTGAADAAGSYLSAGGDEALAYVIAAEGAAAADRPAEARRYAGKALERSEASLEVIFAGIPRSMIWPHDTWAEPAGAFFGPRPGTAATAAPSGGARPGVSAISPELPRKPAPARREPQQPGLWEAASPASQEQEPLDADSEIAAAAAALAVGDDALAALHLGVAVRLAPSAAGAVIQAIGNRREPLLELVRGDALRLLGYEWDARRAYLSVAAGLRAMREAANEVEDDELARFSEPRPGPGA